MLSGSRKKQTPVGKLVWLGVESGLVGWVLLVQFRFLTLCLGLALFLVFVCLARWRRKRWFVPAALLVCLSLFSPVDIALGSFHYGLRRGTSAGGPHLVEFV